MAIKGQQERGNVCTYSPAPRRSAIQCRPDGRSRILVWLAHQPEEVINKVAAPQASEIFIAGGAGEILHHARQGNQLVLTLGEFAPHVSEKDIVPDVVDAPILGETFSWP